jgi:hypothetical protein
MPTNVYFNNYNAKGEQRLYEDLINETIKTWGIDAYFLPRTSQSSVDLIYGEDPVKKFDESYPVEVYVKNVDNFEGNELFSKFGIEIQHQVRFVVSTRSYKARVPSKYSRPREGDLMWLSNFQALFEIKFVNQQHFFYAFGNQNFYGFELICERFRYSDELIESGVIELDDAVNTKAFTYSYVLNNDATTANATYIMNEQVYQGVSLASANAHGTVVTWDKPTKILKLKNVNGIFAANTRVVGQSSNANFTMNTSNLIDNTNDYLDNNSGIGDLADDYLDFSETNPFGEPT